MVGETSAPDVSSADLAGEGFDSSLETFLQHCFFLDEHRESAELAVDRI